jgi:hypothetical protein
MQTLDLGSHSAPSCLLLSLHALAFPSISYDRQYYRTRILHGEQSSCHLVLHFGAHRALHIINRSPRTRQDCVGFNSHHPVAAPELLPTVVTPLNTGTMAWSMIVFASSPASFGNVKNATSVTGASKAAVASELNFVCTDVISARYFFWRPLLKQAFHIHKSGGAVSRSKAWPTPAKKDLYPSASMNLMWSSNACQSVLSISREPTGPLPETLRCSPYRLTKRIYLDFRLDDPTFYIS